MKSNEAEPGGPSHRIPADVPVKVGVGSYRDFQQWIDQELEQLVARWSPLAAPIASRSARHRHGKPRKPR